MRLFRHSGQGLARIQEQGCLLHRTASMDPAVKPRNDEEGCGMIKQAWLPLCHRKEIPKISTLMYNKVYEGRSHCL
ncbi:MAG: hypothetical protein AMJ43_04355 [Coxiella sp. DG_40]|nr:MAG: hypothetical protein AMJ43_04355 [Coxiella sp. DG_40]